jgi:uncharacterized membrane protein YdjX (TVP38/TMEM64 family)
MPPPEKNRVWLKPLVFIAALALVTFLLYQSGLIHFFLDKHRLRRFIDSLGMWGFAGFICLQVIQVVAAPIPGEATGLLGGYLYGPVIGVLLSTTGLTIGSYVAFALSRYFGRPLTERFVDKATMDRFDYLLHHKGAFLIFLLFLIPGFPKDYLCYILGLGHLTPLEFLSIAVSGRLLGTVMLTLGGYYLRSKEYLPFFLLTGVAIVLVFIAFAYKDELERVFRRLHERHLEKRRKK